MNDSEIPNPNISEDSQALPSSASTQFNQWLKVGLLGLVGLVAAVSLIYAGYWYGRKNAKLKTQSEELQLKTQKLIPAPTSESVEKMIEVARQTLESESLDITYWKFINSQKLPFIFKIPQSWVAEESTVSDEIFAFYLESFLPLKPKELSPYVTYGRLIKGANLFQKINNLGVNESYTDSVGIVYTLLDKRSPRNLQIVTTLVEAINIKISTEGFKGCSIVVKEKEAFEFTFPFFDKPHHIDICKAISSSLTER